MIGLIWRPLDGTEIEYYFFGLGVQKEDLWAGTYLETS